MVGGKEVSMAHITGANLCSVEAASSLQAHTPHTRTVSWLQLPPVHCVAPSLAVNPFGHWNASVAPDVGAPHVGVVVVVVVVVQHCESIEEDERKKWGGGR